MSSAPSSKSIAAASQTERLVLNVAIKSALGFATAGLVSVLALRGTGPRMFVTGLGMGSGLGYAWCQNDVFLKDNKAVALPLSLQHEFDKYWRDAGKLVPDFAKFK